MADLRTRVLQGDVRAVARLITQLEEDMVEGRDILASLFPRTGQAHVVGVTGAPGAGKSTVVDGFIRLIRRDGDQVAVLAVDPSSPFTGGAILGDRVRMQDHASDPGVYIRSLASRGHLGGLSAVTPQAVAVLDALGKPFVLIETVGVGQAEVEIVESADTTVVVLTAGWGDGIQAAKAGFLEVADVFVVNKADRPGSEETVTDLKQMLALGPERAWVPPIVATTATQGVGIDLAWDAVLDHRRHLRESSELEPRRRVRLERELRAAVAHELTSRTSNPSEEGPLHRLLEEVLSRRLDPWSAAKAVVGALQTPR